MRTVTLIITPEPPDDNEARIIVHQEVEDALKLMRLVITSEIKS